MKRFYVIPCLMPALFACTAMSPPADVSVQNRIAAEMRAASGPVPRAPSAAVPSAVSSSLLPPLLSASPRAPAGQLEPRFNLKVVDAPIGQVLMAIVQDTRYSVLLNPRAPTPGGVAGPGQTAAAPARLGPDLLTVNLKDVTVFEALDAVREMYGYEYAVEGTRIYVQPPELRTKVYQVNYILGQRRGVSDLQVIGGASIGSSSGGSSGGGGGGSGSGSGGGGSSSSSNYASIQASALSTISKTDVWGEMEDAVRTVLGCLIPGHTVGGSAGAAGAAASTRSGASRSDVSFVGDTSSGDRLRGIQGCPEGRALSVSQTSGTVLVRGMPRELRQVETMLRSMQISIERQVIIEAKIIDVELNTDSQQGINWSAFNQGRVRGSVGANPNLIDASQAASRGTIPAGTSLGDLLGNQLLGVAAPNAFSAGLGVALQFSNFSALINFLETQGRVQVLSSPRIATLNNQKAVLKVGSEEPFVTNITGGSSSNTAGVIVITPPSLSYQPFFSGISLDVTPQIDDNDNITLHVHSMVNSIMEKEKIALPSSNAPRVPFAVNTISETDSVVKTRDGLVVVIGGLMSESSSDNRARVPGAGDVPLLGSLFGRNARLTTKRELVILLRPTVVKGDDAWANDITATQARIERLNAPAPTRPMQ